jgi:hypothetical protein
MTLWSRGIFCVLQWVLPPRVLASFVENSWLHLGDQHPSRPPIL